MMRPCLLHVLAKCAYTGVKCLNQFCNANNEYTLQKNYGITGAALYTAFMMFQYCPWERCGVWPQNVSSVWVLKNLYCLSKWEYQCVHKGYQEICLCVTGGVTWICFFGKNGNFLKTNWVASQWLPTLNQVMYSKKRGGCPSIWWVFQYKMLGV